MLPFDVLTATATQLQTLLEARTVSSVDIVKAYLDQIEKHNHNGLKIHAIVATAPRESVLERARLLDQERTEKGPRGPMHGIPTLVKDAFLTASELGMETTAGFLALRGARASGNSVAVDLLMRAGMIVIGKANLSTQSPYVRGGVVQGATFLGHSTPAGSSSGSGAGVAAGFSPVALGVETNGSVIAPSGRAALYGLKPTPGRISMQGVQGVSHAFDSVGPMTKSTKDLAELLKILMVDMDFSSSLESTWEGVRIGFVDLKRWQAPDSAVEPREDFRKQTFVAMEAAIEKISALGAQVRRSVPLITYEELQDKASCEIDDLCSYDIGGSLRNFFSLFDDPSVKDIQDLINFNRRHAVSEMRSDYPGQQILEAASKNTMTKEKYDEVLRIFRSTATIAITNLFEEYNIDMIMGPCDAGFSTIAMAAGYPVAAVPLGFADFNGRAFSMELLGRACEEEKMLRIMSAWEATFPEGRKPPPMLVNWNPLEFPLESSLAI